MLLTISPVADDRDFTDAIAVRNLEQEHWPLTVEEAKAYDAVFPPERHFQRLLARDSKGKALAQGIVREEQAESGRLFVVDISTAEPDDAVTWSSVTDACCERADSLGAKTLVSVTRSGRPRIEAAMTARGFGFSMRNPVSCLEVERFDFEGLAEAPDRSRGKGYDLMSLADFAKSHPLEWQHQYWRLTMDLLKDVPMPEPFVEDSFEDFKRYMDSPGWVNETRFVALLDDVLVGTSEYQIRKANPFLGSTYLTGVRREHRRRGLARALKVMAISDARSKGVARLYTDNEENNPMYQLNLALGFEHRFDWRIYKREV